VIDTAPGLLPTAASHPWAHEVIAAGRAAGQVPQYASADWLALPAHDPRRLAGLVVAAECWQFDGRADIAAARLREQLALEDHLVLRRIRQASWDVSEALRRRQ
jgi:hypothetical protein